MPAARSGSAERDQQKEVIHMSNSSNADTPQVRTGPEDRARAQLLYSVEEAAVVLRVRPSWLRRKAAAREIPCTHVGRHLRFSHTDLTAIVAASAQPATGRRRQRRPTRSGDLPAPPPTSVDSPNNHDANGSTRWPG
jgi:excisionase family DNA binding protein